MIRPNKLRGMYTNGRSLANKMEKLELLIYEKAEIYTWKLQVSQFFIDSMQTIGGYNKEL